MIECFFKKVEFFVELMKFTFQRSSFAWGPSRALGCSAGNITGILDIQMSSKIFLLHSVVNYPALFY